MAGVGLPPADSRRELQAGDVRQMQVQDDNVGATAARRLDPDPTAFRCERLAPESLELFDQRPQDRFVVVHDENGALLYLHGHRVLLSLLI